MRKSKLVFMVMTFVLFLPFCASATAAEPFVSPDWLEKNLSAPNTVIVDIRKVEEYRDGHVPNAISIFYNSWAVTKSGLGNEVPAEDDLRDLLGGAGIGKDTTVVIVNKADPFVERVNMTRIAWTLKYAGVQNVAILNGGYDGWVAAKKEISKTPTRGKKTTYDGPFNKGLLVDKAQVLASLGKAKIVDTRELPFYTGEKKLDFVATPGHIKGAVNLPSFQIFTDIYFKSKDELAAMAVPVVGEKRDAEIIVYCDSGRVASAWWYILTQVLGYTNVKNYDGSAQDWTKDPAGPVGP